MNWKSFAFGFVAGIAILSAISHWISRPRDVTSTWPNDENKKLAKTFSPWITSSRVAKLGAFAAFVPSDPQKAEAILHPLNASFPMVMISSIPTPNISLIDSKSRIIHVEFDEKNGEFKSYNFSPSFTSGTSYIDGDLDGEYDLRTGPGKLAVRYEGNWLPVIAKDRKKFIEVGGAVREIQVRNSTWMFLEQQ